MTGIAAPLLAGFSLTLIGVIAQDPAHFRWPGATLVTLVITISLLIASVQFGFHARARLYSAADIKDWRPDFFEEAEDIVAEQQRLHQEQWESWAHRARFTYNMAICLLAVGLAMTVAPGPNTSETVLRWGASAAAIAAGAGEIIWIAIAYRDVYSRIAEFLRHYLRIGRPSKTSDQHVETVTSARATHRSGLDDV